MDVSEAAFLRGTRSSDFHGGTFSSPGYHSSSLSLYNAFKPNQVSRDDYGGLSDPLSRDERGIREGHTEPPSYVGYSYTSSFEDMRKRSARGGSFLDSSVQFEDGNSLGLSAYGKYDYGSDKALSFRNTFRDPSLDSYYQSRPGFNGSLPSGRSLPSSLYGNEGQNVGTRHQDLSYPWAADRHQIKHDHRSNSALLNKPDVSSFEQSPTIRDHTEILRHYDVIYPPNYTRSPMDAAPSYAQASELSRKYDSGYSEMFPSFGASGDWRHAMGREHDSGGLLGDIHELHAFGRGANGSRVGDNNAYTDLNKSGMGDAGGIRQVGNMLSSNQGVDLVGEVTGKKKRQSRWEPVEEDDKNGENGLEKKKRKSRWAEEKPLVTELKLPDILKGEDSETIALRTQLLIINRKLQSGKVIEDVPEAARSPSPPPIFDNFGYRVNTREYRTRERLNKERQQIIAKLSAKVPTFKPPPDFKPKCSRKISIPADKYPDYNFVGLIIGPRGNTQKKMEKESGAKIYIRGKGSVREGSSTLTEVVETENLHVLIEADTEESINKAAEMVEKLLVPVGDERNEHKKAQLRELATLNGTLRSKESCQVIQEVGYVAKDMASSIPGSSVAVTQRVDSSQYKQLCQVCKGPGHLSEDCLLTRPLLGSLSKAGSAGIRGVDSHSGLSNDNDDTVVYVSYLPFSVDDTQLRNLFAPLGQVVHAKVIRHLTTGISKCFGFVKFVDAGEASQAAALMNGYKLDGKVLLVKLKTTAGALS